MYPPRISIARIPSLLRPFRPPNALLHKPKLRLFTNNSQLLLVPASVTRPQLPFLHHPSSRNPLPLHSNITLRYHIARLISTENRRNLAKTFKNAFKLAAYFWAGIVLLSVISLGMHQEKIERLTPTPPEWRFWSRWSLRTAKAQERPEEFGRIIVDWAHVGEEYKGLLKRLEDPNIDGKGLLEQDEGGILVEGIGKTGYDLRNMSEPWRRGYFEALMGAGKAAEHMDGWVNDNTRDIAFPPDVVIGPSNPRPKPVPFGAKQAPLEENCSPAFESPAVYYMKILTTAGFNTRQRLDAALTYADWLDFKGLPETAEEMYNWGLDIAAGALPMGANNVVNIATGVIRSGASEHVSENILRASTALAVHHARAGKLSEALPIFLSVLRERREFPPAPAHVQTSRRGYNPNESIFTSFYNTLKSLVLPPSYPPPPPSGDERPFHSQKEACEEAGVMTYIGEILFASSSQEKGLAWTRDAVDAAEATMFIMGKEGEGRERCRECLEVGLGNWKKMVRKLVVNAEKEALVVEENKGGWFGYGNNRKKEQVRKWEAEEILLEERIKRLRPLIGGGLSLDHLGAGRPFIFA